MRSIIFISALKTQLTLQNFQSNKKSQAIKLGQPKISICKK